MPSRRNGPLELHGNQTELRPLSRPWKQAGPGRPSVMSRQVSAETEKRRDSHFGDQRSSTGDRSITFWRTAAQSATIGMFVILLVVALSLARPVLLPVASAFVVTMMLGPLSARAERYRIPSLISAIILWLLVIGVFYGVIVLLAAPVVDWVGKAPDIGRTIEEKLHVFDRPIAGICRTCAMSFLPADKKGSLGRRYHDLPATGGSRRNSGSWADFSYSSAHCFSCSSGAHECGACSSHSLPSGTRACACSKS